MDVQLYVYDLSNGLARQYSQALTGVQIDAIYHTAVVFDRVEYFFGQGIHRKVPGSTHHGRPMKIIPMGQTHLPSDVIEDYIESLEAIYTPESYDLFLHNCNNFSQDLCTFLVGKQIPKEISSLPETFLKTPIGQMLRGQIDQSMRRMTQAPDAVAGQNVVSAAAQPKGRLHQPSAAAAAAYSFPNGQSDDSRAGKVQYPRNLSELDNLLTRASTTSAVIFFTSETCPPCKLVYPAYDSLAEEAGRSCTLIKVDVGKSYDITARYQVRATPTFYTYLKGQKQEEWAGADAARLLGTVRMLIQQSRPQHAHFGLNTPSLHTRIQTPITYGKMPPLDKLAVKLGNLTQSQPYKEMQRYLQSRVNHRNLQETSLPDMSSISEWITETYPALASGDRFALVDLLRISAYDPRLASYLAAEPNLSTLLVIFPPAYDWSEAPATLQTVSLQLLCNMMTSNIFMDSITTSRPHAASTTIWTMLRDVIPACLLAPSSRVRAIAAILTYNLAAYDHNQRIAGDADAVNVSENAPEIEAALIENVINEAESKEALHNSLMALGTLLYGVGRDATVFELCNAMDVKDALTAKSKDPLFKDEALLLRELIELLANGFKSP